MPVAGPGSTYGVVKLIQQSLVLSPLAPEERAPDWRSAGRRLGLPLGRAVCGVGRRTWARLRARRSLRLRKTTPAGWGLSIHQRLRNGDHAGAAHSSAATPNSAGGVTAQRVGRPRLRDAQIHGVGMTAVAHGDVACRRPVRRPFPGHLPRVPGTAPTRRLTGVAHACKGDDHWVLGAVRGSGACRLRAIVCSLGGPRRPVDRRALTPRGLRDHVLRLFSSFIIH